MAAANPPVDLAPISRWKSLTKWQAFGIHLAISLLVFSSLVAVMAYFWFPGELFFLDGGWQGLKLVALVDLVLGPLLTLALYKPGKKGLLLDLSLIAIMQIAALMYGFWATYNQRNVALVYSDGMFASLSYAAHIEANEILVVKELQPKSISEFRSGYPTLLVTPSPTKETYGKYLEDLFNDYPEPHERSDKFLSLDEGYAEMQSTALSIDDLASNGWLDSVRTEIRRKGFDESKLEFYNFRARYAKGVAMFDPSSMTIVDYLAMDASNTVLPVEPEAQAASPEEETADTTVEQ